MVVTATISEPAGILIGLAMGGLGVAAVFASGGSLGTCHLRPRRLSLRGGLALLPMLLLWPFVLSTGEYVGPHPVGAGLGVAGSVAQELFFRSALLPPCCWWCVRVRHR